MVAVHCTNRLLRVKCAAVWQFSGETVVSVRGLIVGAGRPATSSSDLGRIGGGSRLRDQLVQRRVFQRSQAEGFHGLSEATQARGGLGGDLVQDRSQVDPG